MNKPYKFSQLSLRALLQLPIITSLLFFSFVVQAKNIEALIESPVAKVENEHKKQRVFSLPKPMFDGLIKNMVLVEAGTFSMGSDSPLARNREKPVRQVSLDAFYIGKYELTQDLFEQIMGWNNSFFACDKCPVNNVSWLNMLLFIERLNSATGKEFSLPTEAQWAYAAKGGNKSQVISTVVQTILIMLLGLLTTQKTKATLLASKSLTNLVYTI